MDQTNQTLPVHTAIDEFDQLYLRVRTCIAEGQSRSITDAEQRLWQMRTSRVKRLRAILNPDSLADVLDAIAALHTEQENATAGVAAQLAAADARSHR